jgi:hypothetical protein
MLHGFSDVGQICAIWGSHVVRKEFNISPNTRWIESDPRSNPWRQSIDLSKLVLEEPIVSKRTLFTYF